MEDIKDRINQMIYRSQQAIDECHFCQSLLSEQDMESLLYTENGNTLRKLYYINLRMAIIDIGTLVNKKDYTSCYKIINIIREQEKYRRIINRYNELGEYINEFEKQLHEYDKVIDDILDFRHVLVAHTDSLSKRIPYKSRDINLYDIYNLVCALNVFSINLSVFALNENRPLINSNVKAPGLNNSFSKISKFYKKEYSI